LHRLGAVPEEIVMEEFGDADEHVKVNAGTFEHFVDVAALAVDGVGESQILRILRNMAKCF